MPNLEREPQLCPIVSAALSATYGIIYTQEQTRRMVAYVERVKSNCWQETLELIGAEHVSPEDMGETLVKLLTGDTLPDAWRNAPTRLTRPIEIECRS